MNERMNRWVNEMGNEEWMEWDRWMNKRMNRWVNEKISEQGDEWWMNEGIIDEWIDEWLVVRSLSKWEQIFLWWL